MFDLKSLYFNSAYLGPTPRRSAEYVTQMLGRLQDPAFFGHTEWRGLPDDNRVRLAKLVGCSAENLAWSTSVSELVSHVANGLDWRAGDEVLLLRGEYPSMVLPWMVASERYGFHVRFGELADFADPDRFRKLLTARTRYAGCSHVLFDSGRRMPTAALGDAARANGTLYLADVSQAFGGMRVNDLLAHVDILVGVGYKWLCGPYQSAWGYFSERALRDVHRTHASWLNSPNSQPTGRMLDYTTACLPGARKFDAGQTPAFMSMAYLRGTFETLTDLAAIEKHNAELVAHFLENTKLKPVAPRDAVSNIVCVELSDATEVQEKLARANIDASVREGRLRLSFHMFNTRQQVDQLLNAL